MRLIDTNVLVYAADSEAPQHARVAPWFHGVLNDTETIALSWLALVGFIRIVTNPRITRDPYTAEEALDVVDGLLSRPNVVVVHPTDRHAAVLRDLLMPYGAAGNLTNDAHLAALSIEHGATCSCDGDVERLPGVRFLDPLRD